MNTETSPKYVLNSKLFHNPFAFCELKSLLFLLLLSTFSLDSSKHFTFILNQLFFIQNHLTEL